MQNLRLSRGACAGDWAGAVDSEEQMQRCRSTEVLSAECRCSAAEAAVQVFMQGCRSAEVQ